MFRDSSWSIFSMMIKISPALRFESFNSHCWRSKNRNHYIWKCRQFQFALCCNHKLWPVINMGGFFLQQQESQAASNDHVIDCRDHILVLVCTVTVFIFVLHVFLPTAFSRVTDLRGIWSNTNWAFQSSESAFILFWFSILGALLFVFHIDVNYLCTVLHIYFKLYKYARWQ